jgi:hypothetical protein
VFVSVLLISFKAFSCSSPQTMVPVLPSLWLYKGVLPRENNQASRSSRNLHLLKIF